MTTRRQMAGIRGESGQGLVEYILLLVVVIAIAGGTLWRFSTAFRTFGEGFFDGYIGCLIETGELPGIGDCNKEFSNFDSTTGTTIIAGGGMGVGETSGGGGGSSGPTSTSGKDSSSDSSKDSSSDSTKQSSGRDSSSNDSSSNQKNQGEALSNGTGNNDGATSAAGSSFLKTRKQTTSEGKFEGTKEEAEMAGQAPITTANMGDGGRAVNGERAVGLGGRFDYFGSEADEAKAKDRPGSAPMAAKNDGSAQLRAKVTAESGSRGPAQTMKSDSSGFSFGEMLRWLLIIGIILAIIIFFGGQILQASKSGDGS